MDKIYFVFEAIPIIIKSLTIETPKGAKNPTAKVREKPQIRYAIITKL